MTLFETYVRPRLETIDRWDEMVDQTHGVRSAWQAVGEALQPLDPAGLMAQSKAVRDLLAVEGVTYRPHGTDTERPWAVDPVPMLIDEDEWAGLSTGLVQRAELLDLILTDVYGPRRLITDRLLPPALVYGHSGFIRAVDQIRLRSARQLFMSAADLVRAPSGEWQVVADRTQAPSGTAYTMAGRRAVSRALPALYRDAPIERISPFFDAMRMSLQALAPNADNSAGSVPRVVLLTSGAASETAFDQAYLASLLGFPLVEGADLVMRDGRIWQRSIGRLAPVDVILRRVDAWFCDPLELRSESMLGVPGLVEAARLGSVAVVNGLGTGVLENPALGKFLPRLSRELLGADLAIPSVRTWWCGDPDDQTYVLENLTSLVAKPLSREVTGDSRVGWQLSGAELEELRSRILAEPENWSAQEAVVPSVAPALAGHGLAALPISLRCFAVASGGSYQLMAGGMTRVAPSPDAPLVQSTVGSAVKDVWVLSSARETGGDESVRLRPGQVAAAVSPRVAETLFWLGRYAERAEDVSRLIAVADNLARDQHAGRDPNVSAAGAIMLGAVYQVTTPWPPPAAGQQPSAAALLSLVTDGGRVGSLAHDLRRVRELSNASRDQLSLDTWIALRDLDDVLAGFRTGEISPSADLGQAMTRIRAALMAFAGLAAESMVRDSGWHFLDAGRRVERALQLARLLRACLVPAPFFGVSSIVQEATLTAAESIITHRRRYLPGSGTATVLELLLLDQGNPRSLTFQLSLLARDLRNIPEPFADHNPAAELLADLAEWLESLDPVALSTSDGPGRTSRATLDAELGTLVKRLHAIATAIEQTHFPHLGTLRPLVQPVPFDLAGVLS